MTVQELIQLLSTMNPNAIIRVYDGQKVSMSFDIVERKTNGLYTVDFE